MDIEEAQPETFGQRMKRLRQERGVTNPGRTPIAEKYKPQIAATERAFARSMPREAERFVDELAAKEPEQCPQHHITLTCNICQAPSQRTVYNHHAAQYVFDRIMGKPTSRSENFVTVKLVQQLTEAFVGAFVEVNLIDDPVTRQATFAERLGALGAVFGVGEA